MDLIMIFGKWVFVGQDKKEQEVYIKALL